MAETRVRNRTRTRPDGRCCGFLLPQRPRVQIIRLALEVRQHSQHAHRSGLDGWERMGRTNGSSCIGAQS